VIAMYGMKRHQQSARMYGVCHPFTCHPFEDSNSGAASYPHHSGNPLMVRLKFEGSCPAEVGQAPSPTERSSLICFIILPDSGWRCCTHIPPLVLR